MNINSVVNSNSLNLSNYTRVECKSVDSTTPLEGDIISTNIGTVSDIAKKYDVKNISPRDMATLSQNLYDSGLISFENHALLSFQPELNPAFDSTIGKMTNTIGQPDEPRDFLGEWKGRLEQQMRDGYPEHMIKATKEVISILDNLDALRGSFF